MKTDYRVVVIHDIIPKDRSRRKPIAFVDVISKPDNAMEMGTIAAKGMIETIRVSWPAHGMDHYTASVDYDDKLQGRLSHQRAAAISEILKKFIDPPSRKVPDYTKSKFL